MQNCRVPSRVGANRTGIGCIVHYPDYNAVNEIWQLATTLRLWPKVSGKIALWCYNFDPAVSRQPKFGISNALVVYNSTVNVEADRTRKQPIASAHFCGVRKIAAKSKRKNRLGDERWIECNQQNKMQLWTTVQQVVTPEHDEKAGKPVQNACISET